MPILWPRQKHDCTFSFPVHRSARSWLSRATALIAYQSTEFRQRPPLVVPSELPPNEKQPSARCACHGPPSGVITAEDPITVARMRAGSVHNTSRACDSLPERQGGHDTDPAASGRRNGPLTRETWARVGRASPVAGASAGAEPINEQGRAGSPPPVVRRCGTFSNLHRGPCLPRGPMSLGGAWDCLSEERFPARKRAHEIGRAPRHEFCSRHRLSRAQDGTSRIETVRTMKRRF